MIESEYLKDNLKYIERLKKIPSFEDFSEKDLKGILEMSKLRQYEPGEAILKEGSFDSSIFFLMSGTIKVIKDDETLSILRRIGDVFGEMGIIDGSPRSASVYAVDKTVCLATDASYIDRLSGNDRYVFSSILYRIFSQILVNRLRMTSEELIKAKEEIEKLKEKIIGVEKTQKGREKTQKGREKTQKGLEKAQKSRVFTFERSSGEK